MHKRISFDVRRYVNITILQLLKCLQKYLTFSVTFPLFYLFEWKFTNLKIHFFLFYKGKCARPKQRVYLRGFAYWYLGKISQGLSFQLPRFLWRQNLFIMHTPRQYFLPRWLLSNRIWLSLEDCFHVNDTHREKLSFTQFSTRMAAWLLLIFFICLYNHLGSIHSIITY